MARQATVWLVLGHPRHSQQGGNLFNDVRPVVRRERTTEVLAFCKPQLIPNQRRRGLEVFPIFRRSRLRAHTATCAPLPQLPYPFAQHRVAQPPFLAMQGGRQSSQARPLASTSRHLTLALAGNTLLHLLHRHIEMLDVRKALWSEQQ